MVNPKRIEERGITAIKDYLDECDTVDTSYIAINDKNPGLDGSIDIYANTNNEQFSKDNLKFNMPVQVKSTSKNITNNKFPVSIIDLNFYNSHTNGLIYLVVSTATRPRKIFYKKLAPLDIKEILRTIKPTAAKKPTKTLSFKIVPPNPLAFLNILVDFHSQQERQPKSLLDFSDMKRPSKSIVTKIFSQPQFLTETLKSGVYFYRELIDDLSGEKILVPYHSAVLTDLFKVNQTTITNSAGEALPAMQSVSQLTGERVIQTGTQSSIVISSGKTEVEREKKKITFRFTPRGTYSERLHDVKFLISLIGDPPKKIDQVKEANWSAFIESLNTQKKQLSAIITDLKTLGIPTTLDPETLSTKELEQLNSLQRVLHNDLIVEPTDQHIHVKLASYRFDFFIHKNRITNCLTNEFAKRYTLQYKRTDGSFFPINPFTGVRDHLYAHPNFSIQQIMSGFTNMNCTDKEAANYYNYYVLDLLRNYDQNKFEPLLDLAIEILDKIKVSLDDEIIILNKAQIEMRRSARLTVSQLKKVIPLIDNSDELIRLAALVLLNQPDDATKVWNKLSAKKKDYFTSWPISSLSNFAPAPKTSSETE